MSEFLLENDTLSPGVWRSLQKWHAWLSPLEWPTVAKAQYNYLTSSKAHVYKIETSGNP